METNKERKIAKIFSKVKSVKDFELLIKELFTPKEIHDVYLRCQLLQELNNKMPQRKIAKKYNISLCKITRGSKILKNEDSIIKKIIKS